MNALIGIWFVIAPFVLAFTDKAAETWTSVIGGIVVLVLAGSAALSKNALLRSRGSSPSPFEIIAALDFIGIVQLPLAGALALSNVTRQRTWAQYVNGIVGIWFIGCSVRAGICVEPAAVLDLRDRRSHHPGPEGGLAFGMLPKTTDTQ